jgi:CheY-like chemotaxis protein
MGILYVKREKPQKEMNIRATKSIKRGIKMSRSQVLVVDDEWNMRNLRRIYLSKNDISVIEAKNGSEALGMIDTESVDLIILDLMMPDMDGWEVCG